jgi:hypothetical protein
MQTLSYIIGNYAQLGEKWVAGVISMIDTDMNTIKQKLKQSCNAKQLLEQLRSSVAQEYLVEYSIPTSRYTGLEYINGWKLHGQPVDMGDSLPSPNKFRKRFTIHSTYSLDDILNDKIAERILSRITCDYPAMDVISAHITDEIKANLLIFEEFMIIWSVTKGMDRLNTIFNDLVLSPLDLNISFAPDDLEYTNAGRLALIERFKELTEYKQSLAFLVNGSPTKKD